MLLRGAKMALGVHEASWVSGCWSSLGTARQAAEAGSVQGQFNYALYWSETQDHQPDTVLGFSDTEKEDLVNFLSAL